MGELFWKGAVLAIEDKVFKIGDDQKDDLKSCRAGGDYRDRKG